MGQLSSLLQLSSGLKHSFVLAFKDPHKSLWCKQEVHSIVIHVFLCSLFIQRNNNVLINSCITKYVGGHFPTGVD